jgi:hypothetical protein
MGDRPLGEVAGVPVPDLADGPGGGQLLLGVLADGLRQLVAGVPTGTRHHDQRLPYQRIHYIQQGVLVLAVRADHRHQRG